MTVRKLIDLIRMYPDWDVDVKVQTLTGTQFGAHWDYKDIRDVTCNDKSGDIILLLE